MSESAKNLSRSPTWCPLPWKSLAISPSGTIRLCCNTERDIGFARKPDGGYFRLPTDLSQALNSDTFRLVRKQMKEGEWPLPCSLCKVQEKVGDSSDRMSSVEKYSSYSFAHLDEKISLSDIDHLDLRLGTLCNLKCRMCSPYSSSAWESEWEQLGSLVTQIEEPNKKRLRSQWHSDESTLTQLYDLIPNLRSVYLTGGEPFMSKGAMLFVKECVTRGRASAISLEYNSNGTIWNSDLVELWKEFESVNLNISVDAPGELNNYIRYPSNWEKITKNIVQFRDLATKHKIHTSIQCLVQVYNIFHIVPLIDIFSEMGIKVQFYFLRSPEFLSIQAIPLNIAKKAIESLDSIREYSIYPEFLNRLDGSKAHLWPNFLKYTEKLDSMRGQSFEGILGKYFK